MSDGEPDRQDAVAVDRDRAVFPHRQRQADVLEELTVLNLFAQQRRVARDVALRANPRDAQERVVDPYPQGVGIRTRQLDVNGDLALTLVEVDVDVRFESAVRTSWCKQPLELVLRLSKGVLFAHARSSHSPVSTLRNTLPTGRVADPIHTLHRDVCKVRSC